MSPSIHHHHGKLQWNIKFYDWQSDYEPEAAVFAMFGEHVRLPNGRRGFECISELLGRPIESYIAGRSGGWLVIDTELTEDEVEKVDSFVSEVLKSLPSFLKEERAMQAEEAAVEANRVKDLEASLRSNANVKEAIRLIESVSSDYVLTIQGISLRGDL